MMNAGRCPRCHAFLIEEELATHRCRTQLQGVATIMIDHYFETHADDEGHKILFARGFDGYIYRLVVCKHNPPHTANRKVTDNDTNHEGNVTLLQVTLPLRRMR